MLKQLFKTKSLDAILHEGEAPKHQLKRALGSFDVVMLGIGAIIGAGIFATIGTAAAGDALRPGAGGWEQDWDGSPEWWQPGYYDTSAYPAEGWDCDDQNPAVSPASGC